MSCQVSDLEVEHERAGLAGSSSPPTASMTGSCCTAARRPSSGSDRMGEAARLAAAVAKIDGFEGSGALLTIVDASLTVRLTRDLWQLESRHVDLARAVSEVASAHGAVADRASVQEVQLAIASKRDAMDVGFWRAVLGYAPMADDNARRPARTRFDGLDAGARRGQAVAARDARRRIGRARARQGAAGGGTRRGRPHRLGERMSTGRSPIGPGTASMSPPGPMGPPRRLPTPPSRRLAGGPPFGHAVRRLRFPIYRVVVYRHTLYVERASFRLRRCGPPSS